MNLQDDVVNGKKVVADRRRTTSESAEDNGRSLCLAQLLQVDHLSGPEIKITKIELLQSKEKGQKGVSRENKRDLAGQ